MRTHWDLTDIIEGFTQCLLLDYSLQQTLQTSTLAPSQLNESISVYRKCCQLFKSYYPWIIASIINVNKNALVKEQTLYDTPGGSFLQITLKFNAQLVDVLKDFDSLTVIDKQFDLTCGVPIPRSLCIICRQVTYTSETWTRPIAKVFCECSPVSDKEQIAS